MAYATTNPPHMISQTFGNQGPALWSYSDTDPIATVAGSSYFSDGDALGLKVGDVMLVLETDTTLGSFGYISNVTTGAGATFLSSFTTT